MTAPTYGRRDACPVCAAPARLALPAVRSNPAAEPVPFGAHGEFLSGYSTRRVFFTYHRCRTCEALYCPDYFTQAQLDHLYARQAENMADVPLASRQATQWGYWDLVRPHLGVSGDYLELGPDIGLFAELCARHGQFSRFHLFEPNTDVHPILASRLEGRDVHIATAYEPGTLPKESIALAVAIHVLDHLMDPAQVLRAIYHDLVPGGMTFAVTHNEASWLARALGRRWPPYTLQHPQLFSPRSITRLFQAAGFDVVGVATTRNHFPLSHLVRAVFTLAGIERMAPRVQSSFGIRLKLGNIATLARRPR